MPILLKENWLKSIRPRGFIWLQQLNCIRRFPMLNLLSKQADIIHGQLQQTPHCRWRYCGMVVGAREKIDKILSCITLENILIITQFISRVLQSNNSVGTLAINRGKMIKYSIPILGLNPLHTKISDTKILPPDEGQCYIGQQDLSLS